MGLSRGRALRVAAGLAAALSGAFGGGASWRPLAAQGVVRSARFVVDLTADDGSADVRAAYELEITRPGALVPIELLGFGEATAEDFTVEGRTDRILLRPASGSRRVATVRLEAGVGSGAARLVRLVLRYRVGSSLRRGSRVARGEGADRADVGPGVRDDRPEVYALVPLVTVAWPPAAGVADVFSAELRLPAGWAVSESFPTGLRADDSGAYRVELPVVPAVVRFDARTDGAWRPGLALVLDVLAGLALIVFGVIGFRHLRGVAA